MSGNPNAIKVANFAGPPFVAIILNWGLFGALSIQVYLYSQAFPNDKRWLKLLVSVVYFFEMVQTFLLTKSIWNMLVSGFGNSEALDEIGTIWLSVCFIGGLMGFFVQWFYAYRIAVISGKKIIPGFIVLVSLASFSGAIAVSLNLKHAGKFSKLLGDDAQRMFVSVGLWGGVGSFCDMVITICMCYYLRRSNQHGRFSYTEALVSKLLRMSVETGALTATVSALSLVLYYPTPFHGFTYFEVPVCVHGKMYSATLLAVLNSRMKLGIVSESMTWRDNELPVVSPQSRDTNRVELYNTSTDSHMQTTTIIHVTKEEIVTTDDPKVHYLASAE